MRVAEPLRPRIPTYLVVDDSPHGDRLHEELRDHGHSEVLLARSRAEALLRVSERRFDRAVVSVRLGDRPDGFLLARDLRRHQSELRVILLSDYPCVEAFRVALAAGAIDLVLRSHDVPHLQHAFARPERVWLDASTVPLEPPSLLEAEWQHLEAAVAAAAGDPAQAARWLGIDEETLREKLEGMPMERWSRVVHVAVSAARPEEISARRT